MQRQEKSLRGQRGQRKWLPSHGDLMKDDTLVCVNAPLAPLPKPLLAAQSKS